MVIEFTVSIARFLQYPETPQKYLSAYPNQGTPFTIFAYKQLFEIVLTISFFLSRGSGRHPNELEITVRVNMRK